MAMRRKQRPLLIISVTLLFSGVTQAQSGRRATPGSNTTAPATPSTPGAKPVENKATSENRLQLLVGINRADAFTTTPFYVYDTVLDDCIRRLGDAEIVFATGGGNNMNRSAAIKAAKEETTRWVVSLEVKSFYAESGQKIKANQDELFVEYTVVEPVTGKIKHTGRTQHHIYQNGRGGIYTPSKNGPVYSDYSIKQAAIEAADKILASFDIKVRDAY